MIPAALKIRVLRATEDKVSKYSGRQDLFAKRTGPLDAYRIEICANGVWSGVASSGSFGLQLTLDQWRDVSGGPVRAVDADGRVVGFSL